MTDSTDPKLRTDGVEVGHSSEVNEQSKGIAEALWRMRKQTVMNQVMARMAAANEDSQAEVTFNGNATRRTLELLAPPMDESKDRPLSKDLSIIGQFLSTLSEAIEEKVLTEDDAAALSRFIVEKFAVRRFDKTFRAITLGRHQPWFMTAMHRRSHE